MSFHKPYPPTRFSLKVLLLISADLAVVFALVGARHRQHSAQDLVLRDLGDAIELAVWNQNGVLTEVRVKPCSRITPGVELAHLSSLKRLSKLDLRETQLTDAALADVSAVLQLRHLDLSGTQVTDAGLDHLASLAQLETLNLSRTSISDEGLRRLCTLRMLRVLHAEQTQTTAIGVRQFGHLVPSCVVQCDARATTEAAPAAEQLASDVPRDDERLFDEENLSETADTLATTRSEIERTEDAVDSTIALPTSVADRFRELEEELAAEDRDAR